MLSQHAENLAEKIERLQTDRQRHLDAMAAIDRVLTQIDQALRGAPAREPGGSPDPTGGPGAAAAQEWPLPRRRGRFDQTGIDSVLGFVRRQVDPSTAEINAHWRAEGRKGTANVTILKLLKEGLIRREHDPSIRGSRYLLVERGARTGPAAAAPRAAAARG